jgi:hypothetical protein
MQSSLLTGLLALLGVLTAGADLARADDPLAGKWIVKVFERGQELSLLLIDVQDKDGTVSAKVLDAGLPQFKAAKISKVSTGKNALRFTFTMNGIDFDVVAYAPKGDAEPKKLLGSVKIRNQREIVRLDRTTEDKVGKAMVPGPAADEFKALATAKTVKALVAVMRKVAEKFPDDPVALQALRQVLTRDTDLSPEQAPDLARKAMKLAATFGPEVKSVVAREAIPALLKSEKGAALALTYARQAEKALTPQSTSEDKLAVLKVLAQALKKNNKADEATKVAEEVARLNKKLDVEFEKKNLSFKIEPFKGRKEKSDRVAVVELFTGAQCPPCVSADIAFDAMLKAYKPRDVILLQHHLHIPGPDPMASKDSDERAEVYGIQSTPTIMINGKKGPALGGFQRDGEARFQTLSAAVDPTLEEKSKVTVKVTGKRNGEQLDLSAKVGGLPEDAKNLSVYFVVIEDVVHYTGGNGQRLHHHVVRAIKKAEGPKDGMAELSLNLKDIRDGQRTYLDSGPRTKGVFSDDDRPMDMEHLHVVALVQDTGTREILNAAQAPLRNPK